jgi:hypothetical protein
MRARVACPGERAARDIRDAYLLCSDAPDHVLAFWALAGHRGLLNELSKSRFKKERGDVRRKRCFRFEPERSKQRSNVWDMRAVPSDGRFASFTSGDTFFP